MAGVGTWQWRSLLSRDWVCEGVFTIVEKAIKLCINLINTLHFHQASVGRLYSFCVCGNCNAGHPCLLNLSTMLQACHYLLAVYRLPMFWS